MSQPTPSRQVVTSDYCGIKILKTNLKDHTVSVHGKDITPKIRQTDRQTYRQTDIRTDRQTDRQTDRHTDRQTERQKDRPAYQKKVETLLFRFFSST